MGRVVVSYLGKLPFRWMGALWVVFVALGSLRADAQDPLLWGSLTPGPYPVGYRSLFQLDHTRQYNPDYATDPNKMPAHKPRPILINIWYPAQKTGASPMKYGQYL